MTKLARWALGALVLCLPAAVVVATDETGSVTKVSDLYPNDLGPDSVDVSSYPPEHKKTYSMFKFKCAACHTIARPINSQFLELTVEEQTKWKKQDPDLFKDSKIVQVETQIWERYVKRMMAKPGCPIKGEDGKKVWQFLVYDSKVRKTGDKAKAWREQRAKLLADFKKSNPDGYEKLYGEEE